MAKQKKRRHSRISRFMDRLPGRIMTFFLFAAILSVVGLLIYTDMLPMTYIGIILLGLMVLVSFDYLLVMRFRKKTPFWIGTVLFLIIMGVIGLGDFYLYKTFETLHQITNINTETSEISLYVKADNAANSISDARDYDIAILKILDREKTDAALTELQNELGAAQIVEYDSLTDLADSLTGENSAILLNEAYLGVFDDLDGYKDFGANLKKLTTKKVETAVKRVEPHFTTAATNDTGSKAQAASGDVFTVLISGIDTRGGMTASSLSDVNILATVNTATNQVLLVSTPRDYFVPLSISNGIPDKLTHAGIYGVSVCEDTLAMLYETDVHYFFRLNFSGFINIIDALGGIDVYSEQEFKAGKASSDRSGGSDYYYVKGINHLNGGAALAFCRERKAFEDGDRQRGRNQMAVVSAVVKKMQSAELLKNYMGILNATSGCFESNVPYSIISDQVKDQLENNNRWEVFSYSVDGTNDSQKPYSLSQKAYVMIPKQETVDKAKSMMKKMYGGEKLTAEDTTMLSALGGN